MKRFLYALKQHVEEDILCNLYTNQYHGRRDGESNLIIKFFTVIIRRKKWKKSTARCPSHIKLDPQVMTHGGAHCNWVYLFR